MFRGLVRTGPPPIRVRRMVFRHDGLTFHHAGSFLAFSNAMNSSSDPATSVSRYIPYRLRERRRRGKKNTLTTSYGYEGSLLQLLDLTGT